MLIRRLAQVTLCLASCLQVFADANQGSGFLFLAPGLNTSGTRLVGYVANVSDLNPDLDTNGPAHTNRVLATPDGNRFYVFGDGPLQSIDATLTNFQTLNGVAGPIKSAKLTPDGKYLLVNGASFYIIDTATNAVVATDLGISGSLLDFAISRDSTTAYLMQGFSFAGAITPINLTNLTVGTRVDTTRAGTSIEMSPLGQLYVASANQIIQFDPANLSTPIPINIVATPGPLHFTPDGLRLYFVNQNPTIGSQSVFSIRLSDGQVSNWPGFNPNSAPPVFDDLYIAANDRIFAYSSATTTLWDISVSPLGGTPTALNNLFPSNQVYAVAVSDEIPSARFLYVLTSNGNQGGLMRIALANNTISAQSVTSLTQGVLRYTSVPPQTGAATILKYNDNQTITGGGKAQTLIARVTDALGRPVYKLPVTFSVDPNSGVAITTTSAITSADGYVTTTATVPATGAVYTVNVVAGAANTTFTITVPAAGGGNPGGPQLISIFSGDGQLVQMGNPTSVNTPLTAKVVDATGAPRINANIAWSIVSGPGQLESSEIYTDANGLVRTGFQGDILAFGDSFEETIIRAESDSGTADFAITTFYTTSQGIGQPSITLVAPASSDVPIGQGDIVPGLIQVNIQSAANPVSSPIKDVGLRIIAAYDLAGTQPVPGTCVNSTRSDNLGLAKCDFQAACGLTTVNTPLQVVVGESVVLSPINLVLRPGTATKLSLLTGNNQSGTAGQTLAQLLTAQVTDNCGSPTGGATVIWTIVSGSATLSQVVSTSGSDGRVTAKVTLGQTPGPIQVRVSLANAVPVVFNATNNVLVSGISLLSGGGQSALVNQAFTSPVVFQVRDSNNNAVGAGVNVNFSISGAGSINPTSATTNAQGQAQTVVTAGGTTGTITITASYLTLTASATLTVRPQGPGLSSTSFTNAASGANGLVACGLVTAVGTGLTPTLASGGILSGLSAFGPLPYSLGDIDSITVNQVPSPIQSVANLSGKQQVNFQVPCETQTGSATIVVTVRGTASTVTGVSVLAGQPGIFTYAGPNGKVYGAVIRLKDGSYITPSNLAPTGENFLLILTGLGQTTPPTVTNSAGLNQSLLLQTIVGVNNVGVPVQAAGYLQGQIGVDYIQFTIPKTSTAAPGTVLNTDVPLAAATIVNGVPVFGNSVLLPGVVQGN